MNFDLKVRLLLIDLRLLKVGAVILMRNVLKLLVEY